MYLQTFEEKLLPAAGDNRRRYPRVKPDELGRFNAAELEADVNIPAADALPARRKSPLRMAVAGIVAGLVVSGIAVVAFQGRHSPDVVKARAPVVAGIGTDEGEARAAGEASSIASPARTTPLKALQNPHQASAEAPDLPGPRKPEEPVRSEAPRVPVAAVAPGEIIVVMPGPEDDGALEIVSGPANDEESALLVVMQ